MTDETKQIEVTAGSYSGKRLTVPSSVADAAVSDGWARDPFAPPKEPKEGEEPKAPPTDEERAALVKKADDAIAKLRGDTAEGAPTVAEKPKDRWAR